MSLINQMLKDLEKRRSSDLETSDSLSNNISWESRSEKKYFEWRTLTIFVVLLGLIVLVAYLYWERTIFKEELINVTKSQKKSTKTKKQKYTKNKKSSSAKKVSTKIVTPVKTSKNESNQVYAETIEMDDAVDADEVEIPLKLNKKIRPLKNSQLAEIAYNKAYQYLDQGRMSRGKEHLRQALSLYSHHIKAREMLAGIYIKSGHYVGAAELLREGIKIAPDYSLFAKLYARVLLEQNNPQLAIQILEKSATAADVEPDYHALLAATYQRVKNYNKAVAIYLQLVKINPSIGVWWLGLAISLEKSGKEKEALDAYQRAQKSGNLSTALIKFAHNRISALNDAGYSAE